MPSGTERPVTRADGRVATDRAARRQPLAPLALVALLVGLCAAPSPTPREPLPTGPARVEARVLSPPRPQRRAPHADPLAAPRLRMEVVLVAWNGVTARGRAWLSTPSAVQPRRGDVLTVDVDVPEGRRGLRVGRAEHVRAHVRSGGAGAWLDAWRAQLRRSWAERFDRRTQAWLSALLLGDRALLPDATRATFRRCGQSHLLAISGLHVGIVFSVLSWPLRRLRWVQPRVAVLLATLALVPYAGLAGGDPPVLRALVFGVLGALCAVRGGGISQPQRLAVALLVVSALSGGEVHRPGFLLSFAAVAGIALVAGEPAADAPWPARATTRWRRRLGQSLRISTGAWLGSSVPLAWLSPMIVPWAPLFALVTVPLLTLLLFTASLALLPGIPGVDPLLGWCLEREIGWLAGCCRALDGLPATPLRWPPLPPVACAFLLITALLTLRSGPGRLPMATALLAGLTALLPAPAPGITLLDLGRSQCCLVRGDSATLVLDAGSLDRPLGGADVISRELWLERRGRIDLLVLSHAHADHVLAVFDLVEHIEVGTVAVGPRFGDSPLGEAVLARLRRRGIPTVVVHDGSVLHVGAFRLTVWHPPRDFPGALPCQPNDDSLTVQLVGEGLSLLAPGDLEDVGLALVPRPPRSSVLLLPHHGAHVPALDAWLARVRPRVALASRGGPLPAATREAVQHLGVTPRVTAHSGTIRLQRGAPGWPGRP